MANEVCIDGIWYVLNEETKEAMVTSSYNSREEYRGRVIIPKVVVYVHKKYTVTSIGKYAFSCCFRLISITIPESIISIGDEAFGFCLGLISIIVSDKNTKYDSRNNCNAIIETKTNTLIAGCAKTIIPKSVTSIGDNAFYGCDGLSSITIPENVSSIGNYAFSNCPDLAIIVSDKNTKYDSRNNCNAIIETKTNTLIVGCAKTIIPKSVTSIGDNAFYHCNGLASIAIPESVISIGDAAFYRCHDLLSISIPEGVTSIGDAAFYGCHNLSSIIIPGSINTIGENVFRECFGMASVTFDPSTTETALKIGYIKDSPDKCYSPFHDSPLSTIILDRELLLTNKNGSNNNISPSLCKGIFTNIKTATLGKQMKNIMPAMFYQCPLSSITITEGVTNIGNSAFSGCSRLTSITIPESVTNIGNSAFSGCSGLTYITIPESVTSIGDEAFRYCSALISIIVAGKNPQYDSRNNCNAIIETKSNKLIAGCAKSIIPESVVSIGNGAFSGCSDLTSITIPKSVISIGNGAFSDCRDLTSITIPEGVTSIGYGSFSGCNSLRSITIPKSVTGIGNGAFSGCRGLTSVTMPEGLTSIEYETFRGCYSLQSITIPESVTSIEGGAFSGCRALTSVTIPEGVRSIGNDAFCACDSLKSITILEGVTSIGYGAFSGCGYLKSITIPRSVTRIEDEAFKGCFSLTSITIPESVTSIGISLFNDTAWYKSIPDGLVYVGKILYKYKGRMPENTSVEIKEGTIGISSSAFSGCCGLISITIPESVMSIGNFAFSNCRALKEVCCYSLPEGLLDAFDKSFASNIVLYLPKYAIEENKDLSGFKEIIPIEAKVKKIELPETIVLTEKSVRLLTPIITPRYATDQHLKWSSSNEEAAVVNSKGRVVALSSGTATITAMATDGSEVCSSCEIVVRRMVESIQLNQTSLKLVAGNAFSLNATVTPKDAYDSSLTWSTTDDDIAMILGNGRIVAVSAGNATITAKANDGSEVAATCEVTVTEG